MGILTFRSGIKAKAAFFFVKKKDGTIRLIVDGRQANAYHRRPPHSCLATPGILSELDMADFGTVCGELAEAEPCGNEFDVKDFFFHNFAFTILMLILLRHGSVLTRTSRCALRIGLPLQAS